MTFSLIELRNFNLLVMMLVLGCTFSAVHHFLVIRSPKGLLL